MKVCIQIHAQASLLPAENLGVELDWPQMGSGRFGEEKNLSPLSEFKPRIIQTVTPSPYRLRFLVLEFKTGLGPHPISNVIFWAETCSLILFLFTNLMHNFFIL
jgi:hypothetical protein